MTHASLRNSRSSNSAFRSCVTSSTPSVTQRNVSLIDLMLGAHQKQVSVPQGSRLLEPVISREDLRKFLASTIDEAMAICEDYEDEDPPEAVSASASIDGKDSFDTSF